MGNLVVKVQKKGNEVLERTEYTYDTAGNLSAISEEKKEGGNRSILKNAVMTYDADKRLLTYNGETLRYDADGNMTYDPLTESWPNFGMTKN